jgi:hypothetical protein
MNAEILSRIQFALTVSFHFLFPPMTIGLGVVLIVMQTLRLWTGKQLYTEMARFWTRVFGLIFAIGVATGIPMEFQFGTNWARYARFVGDIFGGPLAVEGIYAFFLEAGSSPCCCSAGTGSGRACTCSRPAWSRWAPTSAPSGSWWPTRGCKRPPAITSPGR